jgi:hypothetical protein
MDTNYHIVIIEYDNFVKFSSLKIVIFGLIHYVIE